MPSTRKKHDIYSGHHPTMLFHLHQAEQLSLVPLGSARLNPMYISFHLSHLLTHSLARLIARC